MSNFDSSEFYLRSNWLLTRPKAHLKVDAMRQLDDQRFAVTAAELGIIVSDHSDALASHIENYYRETLKRNLGRERHIKRPGIWLAQLAIEADSEGRWNIVTTEQAYENGGNVTDRDEMREVFHPYWDAVAAADDGRFVPVMNRVSGKALGGAWLMLKLDELRETQV